MRDKLQIISTEIFQFSLVIYLLLLVIETIKTGSVSQIFNLNILLFTALISGIIKALTYDQDVEDIGTLKGLIAFFRNPGNSQKGINRRDWNYITLLATIGGGIVYYKVQELGKIGIFIAVATIVMIVLISYLILTEPD